MISKETEEEILNNKEKWSLVLTSPGEYQYHYKMDNQIFRITVPTDLDGKIKIIKKGDKR